MNTKHNEKLSLKRATVNDIPALYALQLLAFESEAEMIGSRDVPALQETRAHHAEDFPNWTTLILVNASDSIVGSIRYREQGDIIDVGRMMVHPDYRRNGLGQRLLAEADKAYPDKIKELYTCTKSWTNIRLYEKVGYAPYKEVTENSGLSFVYMRKV